MKQTWDKLYESLLLFKDDLQDYISVLPQTKSLRKQQNSVLKLWAESLKNIREFDKFVSPVSPVEILFPDNSQKFINTWNYWKAYLTEQHGIIMRSRFEMQALKLLWDIAEQDPLKATEYLNYAMSRGYRHFFKVDKKQQSQKPKENEKSTDPFN